MITEEEREKINAARAAYKRQRRLKLRERSKRDMKRREEARIRLANFMRAWQPKVGLNEAEADFLRATGVDMIDLDHIPARLRDD